MHLENQSIFRTALNLMIAGRPQPVTGAAFYQLMSDAGARGASMYNAAKAFRLAIFGSPDPGDVCGWLESCTREGFLAALERASCEVV